MGKHQLRGRWSELDITGLMGVSRLSRQKVQNGERGSREPGKWPRWPVRRGSAGSGGRKTGQDGGLWSLNLVLHAMVSHGGIYTGREN